MNNWKKFIKILNIISIIILVIMLVFGILNLIFDSDILEMCTDGLILAACVSSLTVSYFRSKEERMQKYIEEMNKQKNIEVFEDFKEESNSANDVNNNRRDE